MPDDPADAVCDGDVAAVLGLLTDDVEVLVDAAFVDDEVFELDDAPEDELVLDDPLDGFDPGAGLVLTMGLDAPPTPKIDNDISKVPVFL